MLGIRTGDGLRPLTGEPPRVGTTVVVALLSGDIVRLAGELLRCGILVIGSIGSGSETRIDLSTGGPTAVAVTSADGGGMLLASAGTSAPQSLPWCATTPCVLQAGCPLYADVAAATPRPGSVTGKDILLGCIWGTSCVGCCCGECDAKLRAWTSTCCVAPWLCPRIMEKPRGVTPVSPDCSLLQGPGVINLCG